MFQHFSAVNVSYYNSFMICYFSFKLYDHIMDLQLEIRFLKERIIYGLLNYALLSMERLFLVLRLSIYKVLINNDVCKSLQTNNSDLLRNRE